MFRYHCSIVLMKAKACKGNSIILLPSKLIFPVVEKKQKGLTLKELPHIVEFQGKI